MKKQKNFNTEIEEIKNKLPRRSGYVTISTMIGGRYKSATIKHMFAQRRTMSPLVLEAAKKLVDFIKPDTTETTSEN